VRSCWIETCNDADVMPLSARDYDLLARVLNPRRPRAGRVASPSDLTPCLLAVSLVLISVVVAIGSVVFSATCCCSARRRQAEADVWALKAAIAHWQSDTDQPCPATLDRLFIDKYVTRRPKDPWGQEFLYRCPGTSGKAFDIASKGPDKMAGTDDDIDGRDL